MVKVYKSTAFPYLVVASIIIICSILILVWWQSQKHLVTTDNAYLRGSITTISSRISGHVKEVPGVVNTEVKKNDLLVVFDDEPFKAIVDAANAEVGAAKARIEESSAKIKSVDISVKEARERMKLIDSKSKSAKYALAARKTNRDLSALERNRARKLFETKTATKARLDSAEAAYTMAQNEAAQAEAELTTIERSREVVKAEIEKILSEKSRLEAEKAFRHARLEATNAALDAAETDLKSTLVKAPISGIIANRIVEPGVYMEDGWPLMSIVPLEDIWVIANFKETQLENIKEGQEVYIKIDAFPNKRIKGKVLSLSPASAASFSLLPPQNASGNFVKVVQRLPVKISLVIPNELVGKMVPGMSVIASINTKSTESNNGREK